MVTVMKKVLKALPAVTATSNLVCKNSIPAYLILQIQVELRSSN